MSQKNYTPPPHFSCTHICGGNGGDKDRKGGRVQKGIEL